MQVISLILEIFYGESFLKLIYMMFPGLYAMILMWLATLRIKLGVDLLCLVILLPCFGISFSAHNFLIWDLKGQNLVGPITEGGQPKFSPA